MPHSFPQLATTERSTSQRTSSKVHGLLNLWVTILSTHQSKILRRQFQMVLWLSDHYNGKEHTVSTPMVHTVKSTLVMATSMTKVPLSIQLTHLLFRVILWSMNTARILLKTRRLLLKTQLMSVTNLRMMRNEHLMAPKKFDKISLWRILLLSNALLTFKQTILAKVFLYLFSSKVCYCCPSSFKLI